MKQHCVVNFFNSGYELRGKPDFLMGPYSIGAGGTNFKKQNVEISF